MLGPTQFGDSDARAGGSSEGSEMSGVSVYAGGATTSSLPSPLLDESSDSDSDDVLKSMLIAAAVFRYKAITISRRNANHALNILEEFLVLLRVALQISE
ncbi:hypothetical protein PC118_g10019 [Phytophthora cactorum]|uniref:Uncharacterized protein n=1 Tax=Phytophthora cactorum TaxID=29920 RepID=A0A8T1CHW7_9STRA|nr:hypothetical protein PC111_g14210 [Phytophthora cactorum]KAG2823926.1 hypothetical protein PC112_g10316 [Phytophthora cactorum]KAG2908443.1 hypothetical protein PC114_g10476 [Phytophthora cactorum]KAG2921663.1 hypothetical protein PC115_g9479 [Phytophthora cactorum]KAG2982371.1 hypothetical protein PC118_g10019 [Phytophthora cactorum]